MTHVSTFSLYGRTLSGASGTSHSWIGIPRAKRVDARLLVYSCAVLGESTRYDTTTILMWPRNAVLVGPIVADCFRAGNETLSVDLTSDVRNCIDGWCLVEY